MFRYGKKHDRYNNDKLARSNRGRARTSATARDRKHANLGFRRSQTLIVESRANKKRARLAAQLLIKDELFDLDLAKYDPEIWLGGDLTTFKDTVTKRLFKSTVNSYDASYWDWDFDEFVRNAYDFDDEFRRDAYNYGSCDFDDAFRRDAYNYGSLDFGWDFDLDSDPKPDPDPVPSDAAWRDLWVAGRAHDAEGRDMLTDYRWYDDYDYDDCYYDGYDDDAYANALQHESTLPATIEAAEERAIERHRAGERYFKQTGRTVLKSTMRQQQESSAV